MARWEDTALSMPKITKDPILALIESQVEVDTEIEQRPRTSAPVVEEGENDSPDEWDSVYGDQDEANGRDVNDTGTTDNPIDLDGENFPSLSDDERKVNIKKEEHESNGSQDSVVSLTEKMRSLQVENAFLLTNKEQLEKRISELENLYHDTIPGVSNHTRSSKDYENLSATVLIDGREILVTGLSPRMSGWDFTRKVSEAAGIHPGHMIVMQHSPIQLDLPLNQLGLGMRPFYAVSLGHRRIERGRSIKVQLLCRGPLI